MWSRIKSSFIGDIKIILHDNMLLARSLAPFILIILLKFAFAPLSGFIFSKTGLLIDNYYSFIALTFISLISILPGVVSAFIVLDKRYLYKPANLEVTTAERRKSLLVRMIISAFFSFILVMITILLAKPVRTEGWLRNLFAAFLLSTQSPFVFLFISGVRGNRNSGSAFSRLYWMFLIAAPLGLLLHHPWNYLAFYSPLYWIAWAWIVQSPLESLIYGSIGMILTSSAIILFFRHLLRKYSG